MSRRKPPPPGPAGRLLADARVASVNGAAPPPPGHNLERALNSFRRGRAGWGHVLTRRAACCRDSGPRPASATSAVRERGRRRATPFLGFCGRSGIGEARERHDVAKGTRVLDFPPSLRIMDHTTDHLSGRQHPLPSDWNPSPLARRRIASHLNRGRYVSRRPLWILTTTFRPAAAIC